MTTGTKFPLALALIAPLALAACSGNSKDQAGGTEATTGTSASPTPTAATATATATSGQPIVVDRIPASFQGVWDSLEANCDPNSDLRMEIGPKAIGFYESHGDVTRVEIDNPLRIVVSLAMEGEGEKWQMARELTLSEDGKTLTPTSVNEYDFEPVPMKKCD